MRFNFIQKTVWREGWPASESLLATRSDSQLTVLVFKLCMFSNSMLNQCFQVAQMIEKQYRCF